MNNTSDEIKKRFELVRDQIDQAAQRSGRSSQAVNLLVVTKGQPAAVIRNCFAAGITQFGENYPEESVEKITALQGEPVHWHMIGHLQSRKAKIITEYFDMMHSVDRLSLAEKLNNLLMERNRILPIMLEMNVADEESKSGWNAAHKEAWDLIIPEIEKIQALSNLRILGLMTMPPFSANPEDSRPYFKKLVELGQYLERQVNGLQLSHLSMGTSEDFLVAVEEGATYVRIGRAILGPRPPKTTSL